MILMFFSLLFSTFISEDLACISVGLLASQGKISLKLGILALAVGILIGDIFLFLLGRYVLRSLLGKAPLKYLVSKESVYDKLEWLNQKGVWLVFFSRFAPGTRLPVYLAAGLSRVPAIRFLPVFILAVALWTPFLVVLSYYLGDSFKHLFEAYIEHSLVLFVILITVLLFTFKLLIPLFSFRGRRLLYSSYLRIRHWEFWNPWVFNFPLFVYYFFLCVRHRCSLTVITLANPSFFLGGFISESKSDILKQIQVHSSHRVPSFVVLDPQLTLEEKYSFIFSFLKEQEVEYPFVLKPDIGARGSGVHIVYTADQLSALLPSLKVSYLVQAYVSGVEFGLFYYRHPSHSIGTLSSITQKKYLSLIANGVSTLEELILSDSRAICMASFFLEKHKSHLHHIYPLGEVIPLADIGNHCRGALFLDGNFIYTDALACAVQEISVAIPGFYYGRYDVKADSIEALMAGHFSIIELNGATAEPTHIYDPKHGIFYAYQHLFLHWKTAFEISLYHYKKGQRPVSLFKLLGILLRSRF